MATTVLYVTFSDLEEAQLICRTLVEEKLAACCNIISNVRSIYLANIEQGEVAQEDEVIAIIKTSKAISIKTLNRLRELHSYETPCILELNVGEASNTDYTDWVWRCLAYNS